MRSYQIGCKVVGLLIITFTIADGLMFHLEPNSRKCLKEEIHKGVLVTGDYDAQQISNQVVDLMVIDTKGQHFVNRENTDTGKFWKIRILKASVTILLLTMPQHCQIINDLSQLIVFLQENLHLPRTITTFMKYVSCQEFLLTYVVSAMKST